MYTYMSACTYIRVHIYVCIYYPKPPVSSEARLQKYIHMYIYEYVYICIYIYTCVYIYIILSPPRQNIYKKASEEAFSYMRSVLQCVAVCCSVLQSVLQCVAVCCRVCCSVAIRRLFGVCCSVLQSVLQCSYMRPLWRPSLEAFKACLL